jgi:hypothetical protein
MMPGGGANHIKEVTEIAGNRDRAWLRDVT